MSTSTLPVSSTNATSSSVVWQGSELTQDELMAYDTVLVLDTNDKVIGSASKKDSHIFNTQQPHGILHRAFSVFLFDISTNKLLLHKRASHKITFPNVWTNTCCSHPLHGMDPPEVDHDVTTGDVPGIKNAAIRKLEQELGIPIKSSKTLPIKLLTRLHYWAADTITHGQQSPWGEHEIDYVLFMTVPTSSDIVIQRNADEIDEIRWVSKSELDTMLADSTNLFSPWFRLIYNKWIKTEWWEDDITITMNTDKHVDLINIHRFDPPIEHYGGGGNAGPLFTSATVKSLTGDTSKKQGSYGKVKTHSESKLSQLMRLDEVFAAFQVLCGSTLKSNLDSSYIKDRYNKDDLVFCDTILKKVARSFAVIIRQLPDALLVDTVIFYLVLRALDTIEDDMTVFESNKIKIEHLHTFHEKLGNTAWTMDGVGLGDERVLLQKFDSVSRLFNQLPKTSQEVIVDITKRMAYGMAEFVERDLGQGTENIPEYNRYCHYVAGLVGEGLSRLFAGLESPNVIGAYDNLVLADQMGIFLQKTNIIRDFLEDYADKRAFWPQSVWKKYSATGDLGYFASAPNAIVDPTVRIKSLQCLNELVTDALELVPDCLQHMSRLTVFEIFRFSAIPQVMAIATLEKCYNNYDVFTGVVKIRKGLCCKLILRTNSFVEVCETFHYFASKIKQRAVLENQNGYIDPNYIRTLTICDKICRLTTERLELAPPPSTLSIVLHGISYPMILTALVWSYIPKQGLTNKLQSINSSKVWTNTCCSHPLHGMDPPEVDHDVTTGDVPGIKNAAIRKLEQELGIPIKSSKALPIKLLTRLHYWAADTITHGQQSPWGEHEIDYVLFMTVPTSSDIVIQRNADEIDEIRWVSKSELDTMLADSTNLFSPWFRLIYNKWIKTEWWEDDITITMNTDKHVDLINIHRFDPPIEHYGGGGNAGPLFTSATVKSLTGDTSKKQGSYGKVKTHSESKLSQLMRLDEVFAAFQVLCGSTLKSNLDSSYIKDRYNKDDLVFCDTILKKVARSFAVIIRQLPDALLVDTVIFYLVLRALDTIEDDMTVFESNKIKIEHLHTFHEKLGNTAWTMDGVGLGDERVLLQKFDSVSRLFNQLPKTSQEVIVDITKRMAYGMAEFVERDLGQGTENIPEYNRYCHYVAGLVGEGLSRLFAGLESPNVIGAYDNLVLADQMGIFLQKTNIIRDFLEDYADKRAFWPQSVWKKYSATGDLGYFASAPNAIVDPTVRIKSLQCLNELVTDALELVPDCLQHMSRLTVFEIFRFSAIPQVMAIATLEKCYNNYDVFTGVVKIRKGLCCKLILRTNSFVEVCETFHYFASKIKQRAVLENQNGYIDPNYIRTLTICDKICRLTTERLELAPPPSTLSIVLHGISYPMILTALVWSYIPKQGLTNKLQSINSSKVMFNETIIRAVFLTSGSILYMYFSGSNRSYNVHSLRKAGSLK